MIIYVYGEYITRKTDLRFLNERGVMIYVKEITQEPPSITELRQMLLYEKGNLKKLFQL